MKVVGLLSWFDEDPDWLYAAARSAMTLCDHVVALDGAYDGFPGAAGASPPAQAQAVSDACGGECTVEWRHLPWANQIEKRSALFALGATVTDPGDWYFVFDADDRVRYVATDVPDRLERTSYDVAVYTLGGERYHRGLFRAFPSLRVEDAHYHYLAEKAGKTIHLRGHNRAHDLAEFLDLSDMIVAHLKGERTRERETASAAYRQHVQEANWDAVPA